MVPVVPVVAAREVGAAVEEAEDVVVAVQAAPVVPVVKAMAVALVV